MADITHFTLYPKLNQLKVKFDNEESYSYAYEYLRVFSPSLAAKKTTGKAPLVTHKKLVKLLRIEAVGKHGYRFIFDDEYADIYHADDLVRLAQQHDSNWSQYLEVLKISGHNREAMINITEVK